MSRLGIILPAFLTFALGATDALANMYRYKDDGGSVHIGYAIPPELVDNGYEVLNERGMVIQTILPKSVLDAQRKLAKSFMLPIIWGTDPDMEGRTLSVARDANIPSIYIEIGGAGIYDELMTGLAYKGCMNVLKHLEMLPEKPKKESVMIHLEDFRKHSGHLQKLLPSPCDGFYLPKVSLGQRVTTGDIIGHVQDILGENSTCIRADQDGLIFILRNPPSVKEGDALGAILPANEIDKIQSIYE